MNFSLASWNHHSADLSVRERIAFSLPAVRDGAYELWKDRFPDTEMVLLSTCNRIELYAAHPDKAVTPTSEDLVGFVAEVHDASPDELRAPAALSGGLQSVQHLFEVVCSIDSMVLGEPQIVTQVRTAYESARSAELTGPLMHRLFQRAMAVSADVRTRTRLAEGRVSIASVAVGEFGRQLFENFDHKKILVIGAGEMAAETLRYLQDAGAPAVQVANRSPERAEKLAQEFRGQAVPLESIDELMSDADIVISTTGSPDLLVDEGRFRAVRERSRRRPILILDLAAPRDFAPAVASVDDNVFLVDIDALEQVCERNRRLRAGEVRKAREIIEQHTRRLSGELNHASAGPVIKQLRDDWSDVRNAELERLFNRLDHLSDSDRQAVEETVHRILNKLLHSPMEALKTESRQGTQTWLVDAMRRLFQISEPG